MSRQPQKRSCRNFSRTPEMAIERSRAEKIKDAVLALEKQPDVHAITRLLAN